jgi:hypothetical protein
MVYTLGWRIPDLVIYSKGEKMVTGTLDGFLKYYR